MSPATGRTSPPAVLWAGGVRRAFGGEPAVGGVDLDLRAGQIHAVVGLNGAGKSTLLRLLTGMLRPDAGRIEVFGRRVTELPRARWGEVGHLIDGPLAYPELTVTDNLGIAARLHGLPKPDVGPAVGAVTERLGLGRWAGRRTRTLSLGNRQRLGLACALVHRPRLLVLDEPTGGLDPAGVLLVRGLLHEHAAGGGAALLSGHHLDELARVADRISVLHRGVFVGTLDPAGVDLERRFFALVEAAERHYGEAGRPPRKERS